MDRQASNDGNTFVEDTYLAPQFGLIEYLRRVRENQLSTLVPEAVRPQHDLQAPSLPAHFLINKPEYIEHVLLTNHAELQSRAISCGDAGAVLGDGLLPARASCGGASAASRPRRSSNKRIAAFLDTLSNPAPRAMLRAGARGAQPFDVAAEMMALTLESSPAPCSRRTSAARSRRCGA